MRKLMIFCFTILFAVLSALSCLNFAFSALDQVEEDKLMLTIEKPAEQSNSDFLADIDHALAGVHADLMFRHVDNSGENPIINITKQTIQQIFSTCPPTLF